MSDPKMACRADYPAKLSWIVRMATPEDAQDIIDMIKELAVYENMGDQVRRIVSSTINLIILLGMFPMT